MRLFELKLVGHPFQRGCSLREARGVLRMRCFGLENGMRLRQRETTRLRQGLFDLEASPGVGELGSWEEASHA